MVGLTARFSNIGIRQIGVHTTEIRLDIDFDARQVRGPQNLIEELDAILTDMFNLLFQPRQEPLDPFFMDDDDDDDAADEKVLFDDDVDSDTDLDEVIEDRDELPLDVFPNDRIGTRLEFLNDDGVFYKMTRARDNPLSKLFAFIKQLIMSKRFLLLDRWTFTFQLIRVPIQFGRKRKIVWSNEQMVGKKSRVEIRALDKLCLWRALVCCRAYAAYRTLKALKHKAETTAAHKRYKAIIREGSLLQRELALQLQEASNTWSGDYDDLIQIAQFWKTNITVLNRTVGHKSIEFRTQDVRRGLPFQETLYLLKVGQHFDCINSAKGWFNCGYYCDNCNVRGNNKDQHRCPGSKKCWLCNREPEDHVAPCQPPIYCADCFRSFTDVDCHAIHLKKLCARSWR